MRRVVHGLPSAAPPLTLTHGSNMMAKELAVTGPLDPSGVPSLQVRVELNDASFSRPTHRLTSGARPGTLGPLHIIE